MTATVSSRRSLGAWQRQSPLALFRQFQSTSAPIEDPLRKVAMNAPGVVCQFRWQSQQLSVPFIAPNCRQLLGVSATEIQTNVAALLDRIHPEDIDSFWDSLNQAIATLQPWHWQGQLYSTSGKSCTVHLAAEPIVQSEELLWNGFLVHISQHAQRTEVELRDSQQRLRLLIQQTPIAIIQWDTQFQVQKWNPAAEHTFGYPKGEVLGQHLGFLLPDEARGAVLHQFTSLLTQSGISQSIHHSLTKQGQEITCEWYNYPLLAPNGTLISIVSMVLDISDRQRAERELRQRAEQLQQMLQELQQTQSQLIQSAKMSSLGQLVAGVAHEINNPVNFIAGNIPYAQQYAEKLLDSSLNEEDRSFIQQDFPKVLASMQMGVERIRSIVRSLRNFARLDESDRKAVEIHEGIDSTLMVLQNRLRNLPKMPDIQVIKTYGELPLVECYPGHLNQVFLHVLTNAIDTLIEKSAPTPTIQITTCLTQDWVQIRIADNGNGMTESVRDRIFDPFFTTKPVGKGTGLGLSISYQIVTERHQGRLQCHSELGSGSEFVIEIPRHSPAGDAIARIEQRAS
jgi:PAS domain S-box-containing protein